MKRSSRINKPHITINIVIIVILAIIIFPFIWMFFGAFKTNMEVMRMPPQILPGKFNFDNFTQISKLFPLGKFLFNSVFVAVLTTGAQVLFSAMAGYVFAKIKFWGKELLFVLLLVTMMIPFQLSMITLYRVFVSLNLDNKYLGLILPGTYNALGIFMLRQNIMTIPDSFLEASFMDGASHIRTFFKIILPLCKPVLATVAVLAFMSSWNSFIWPLIIISDSNMMTLPIGLSRIQGRWTTQWNLMMAGNLISFIPMLLVYIFAQKYFIKSVAGSGIKG